MATIDRMDYHYGGDFPDDIENKGSIYGVEDTWENYDDIEPAITEKYIEWKEQGGLIILTVYCNSSYIKLKDMPSKSNVLLKINFPI